MSESNSRPMEPSSQPQQSLRRPTGSILAPSKLSFGVGIGVGEKSASSGNVFASKVPFSGLKASKLSSVAQAVCSSLKQDEPEKPPASATNPPPKPNFIPLAKEQPTLASTESTPAISTTTTSETPAASAASVAPAVNDKFVFGEKLDDRAANYDVSVKNGDGAHSSKEDSQGEKSESSDNASSKEKAAKTLTESAAEYVENHNKKVELDEVELITGEENETNVCQMSAKLYLFDKVTSSWVERGRGQLRLNDEKCNENSRLIMRTSGSLRVILNSKVFPEMTLEKPTEKNIRLTAMDGDQGMKVFLVSGTPKDIGTLFAALNRRLESAKKASTSSQKSSPSTAVKRKKDEEEEKAEDEENPQPPEKEAKKSD